MSTSASRVETEIQESSPLGPAFSSLFEAEFGYVCRALRRLGVREADLKDVAQELFVAVHGKLAAYDPARPIRPWLFSFAVRYASNYRRLARNREHIQGDDARLGASAHSSIEARDLVLRALESLDFGQRTAIVMHDFEGFAAPEIADTLKIPVNTVYSRIRLGRAGFRKAVEALQNEGGAS